jgi:hypothetical protein
MQLKQSGSRPGERATSIYSLYFFFILIIACLCKCLPQPCPESGLLTALQSALLLPNGSASCCSIPPSARFWLYRVLQAFGLFTGIKVFKLSLLPVLKPKTPSGKASGSLSHLSNELPAVPRRVTTVGTVVTRLCGRCFWSSMLTGVPGTSSWQSPCVLRGQLWQGPSKAKWTHRPEHCTCLQGCTLRPLGSSRRMRSCSFKYSGMTAPT